MKLTILSILFLAAISSGIAQSDTAVVGKIVYYEGKVDIGTDPKWNAAKINMQVRKNQFIRTTSDGMAEITWASGKKSIVGPNSKIGINDLLSGSSSAAKTETEGVFNTFKGKVKASAGKKTEEGGIRRDQAKTTEGKEEEVVYWKEDKEINFEEAYAFYEAKDYGKAIAALQAFINQKPKDENAKYALFALGHAYIMSNNTIKAKEIFQNFILEYPTDSLKADAETVLAKL